MTNKKNCDQNQVNIIIENNKFKEIFFNDKFYKVNEKLILNFSDAIRLSKIYNVRFLDREVNLEKYDPQLFKINKIFGLIADWETVSGYGTATSALIKYSLKAGYDVRWIGRQIGEIPDYGHKLKKEIPPSIGVIWHEQPKESWLFSPFKKNLALTPFETTKIPKSWIHKINNLDGIMVPCEHNVKMMEDSGIKIPIRKIHWGIDDELYYPLERPDKKIFTFGIMGALSIRKGMDILDKAFVAAFPPHIKDVELLAKTSHSYYPFMTKDNRIKVYFGHWTKEEIMEKFFQKIDCFVFPTRGEGFGLPPLEAMATGVPTITTNYSGPVDYMNKEVGWVIDYKLIPAKDFSEKVYKEDCGEWAEPNLDDLVEKMRYAYTHRDEVKDKGRKAAEYVKKEWLWEKRIEEFHKALKELLE